MSAGSETKRNLGVGMPGPKHDMADMAFSVRRIVPQHPEPVADPAFRESEYPACAALLNVFVVTGGK